MEVKSGLGDHILFLSKVGYQNFSIIAKIWQSENFAGIAKIRYAIAKFTVPLC